MNYFERLVRRAVRQPVGAANAVSDPFEVTETWPLDGVADVLAHREASMPAETSHTRTNVQRELAQASRAPVHVDPPSVPASPPPLPIPPVPTVAQASDAHSPAEIQPIVPSAIESAPSPPQSALEATDRFMQAIGVRVPEDVAPETKELPAPKPSAPAPTAKDAASFRSPRPTVQSIAPPSPAVPEPPATRARDVGDETAAPTRDDAQASSVAPSRRTNTIIETRRVIRVEPSVRDSVPGSATGAGSPHYGLGQL